MPKKNDQIIGAFILRNEGDGCLTSKYHHGDSRECPFTESCKLVTQLIPEDLFLGTYFTSWIEDERRVFNAELTINRDEFNNRIFRLFWRDAGSKDLIFEGTAMNFEGLLVGTYWS